MIVKKCQLCGSNNIKLIIDLGKHPLADTFLKNVKEKENFYPLKVFLCQQCGYTGLACIVSAPARYQKSDYSYTSSNSPVSVGHFGKIAEQAIGKAKITRKDLVVDIGSNVGTLLKAFNEKSNCKIIGIEPAPNIAKMAKKEKVPTIQDFFGRKSVEKILKRYGKAKIIICTNVFNHINDLNDFMRNIDNLLDKDGFFVFETPYMLDLVKSLSFDTIYLEHVSYFSVKPFETFFKKFGFYIHYLEKTNYMGGSIRVYISKKPFGTAQGEKNNQLLVNEYIKAEEDAKVFDLKTYEVMMQKVRDFKLKLYQQISQAKSMGGKIVGIGAATKGNTLLNYCGINNNLLDFITDSSPLKIGKFTPGSKIPIKSDNDITPDVKFAVILPWNIAEFLKKKLSHLNLEFIIPHMQD